MKKLLILIPILLLSLVAFCQKEIPGVIEAEQYDSMSGVQTQPVSDLGGGINVGWIDKGDWMKYTVKVDSSGTYLVSFRVACPYSGASFQLIHGSDSTILSNISFVPTGGFQNWITVGAVVKLSAGVQTLEILSTSVVRWNINWMRFDLSTPPAPVDTISIKEQLDSFSHTLDSTIVKIPQTFSLGTVSIDTLLSFSGNVSIAYWIHLDAENLTTKDCGRARKFVSIKFLNGVYTISLNQDDSKYAGEGTLSKAVWTVVLINGLPVIQVIPNTANPVKWVIYRTQHNTPLL